MFRWFKRCEHEWDLVVDKVLKSGYEQLAGKTERFTYDPTNFFLTTSITILKCTECGTLDKTIVRST